MRALLASLLPIALAACNASEDDGVTDVAIIGTEQGLYADGLRLPFEGQHLRARCRAASRARGRVRADMH